MHCNCTAGSARSLDGHEAEALDGQQAALAHGLADERGGAGDQQRHKEVGGALLLGL